jgi:hypothetical protein
MDEDNIRKSADDIRKQLANSQSLMKKEDQDDGKEEIC